VSPLRDAMLALHEELGGIELDIAELGDLPPTQRAEAAAPMQRRHDQLAQFFDWAVYHDQTAATP
jgi:hypothetical protein